MLWSCTNSYATENYDKKADYSCAQSVGPVSPTCATYGDCYESWAPPGSGLYVLDYEFATAVYAQRVLVYENYYTGFVSRIEVFNLDQMRWENGTLLGETDRVRDPSNIRVASFPIPGHYRTKRLRIVVDAATFNDEIDAVLLVGSASMQTPTPNPTPNPTPAPTPVPGENDAKYALPTCPPASVTECAGAASCQFACAIVNCTQSYATERFDPESSYSCAKALGPPDCSLTSNTDCGDSFAPDEAGDAFLDVQFVSATYPTAVVVWEPYYVCFVERIDLWNAVSLSWVVAYTGTEPDRTRGGTRTTAFFALCVIC